VGKEREGGERESEIEEREGEREASRESNTVLFGIFLPLVLYNALTPSI
jgi:hypothetical protein